MNKFKYLLLGLLLAIGIPVFAISISVPSAPSAGYGLVATSTGNYIATTTSPWHVGSIFATSTTQTNFFLGPVTISTSTAGCATFSSTGVLYSVGTACGSGSGGGSYPFTPSNFGTLSVSATTTAIVDYAGLVTATSTIGTLVASSSLTNQAVASALVLDTATGLESAYGGSANCTNQVVNGISAVGAGNCVSLTAAMFSNVNANTVFGNPTGASAAPSFFGTSTLFNAATLGQVLMYNGSGYFPFSTTTFANGTGITNTFAGNQDTITNTGVISGNCSGGTTCSGTNPLTINSYTWPWTLATNYNVTTNSTTTPTWYKTGVYASSTSAFDQVNIGSTTVGTMSTSTNFGNWVVKGVASSTQLVVSNSPSALLLTGVSGAVGAYTGSNPCTNQVALSISATGAISCTSLAATQFGTVGANTVLMNNTGASAVPTFAASTTLFSGTTGQAGWFSASGALIGTSSILFTAPTTTIASDVVIQKTSPNMFQLLDNFGTPILNVNSASSTGPIFAIFATTTSNAAFNAKTCGVVGGVCLFQIDQYGHFSASSTVPVLSSCGTTPSLSPDSSDAMGTITVGSVAATACTLTFGSAHTVGTHCVISNQSMSVVNAGTYTESLTGFTFSQTGLTSAKLDYWCSGL